MIQYFKKLKLNNQKGSSIVQLMAVLAMASITVGGVSIGAGEILNQAKDTQRVANLRQLATVLELYYLDNQSYPHVIGENPQKRFDNLFPQLANYLDSFPTEKKNYDYQDFNSGQNYILRTLLENPADSYSREDSNDLVGEIDCSKSSYCIKM